MVAIGDIPALTNRRPATPAVLPPMPDRPRPRAGSSPAILTAIAAVVRLVGLGDRTDGGTPLFDEKYYAIQAQEILRNGGVEDNQGFGVVVHPPFGKQLIAIGEWLLGYTPTGWRLASAVAGIVSVLLIIRVVRRMTRSTLLGGIAGVLLICDGVSHVQSRSALLDIFQAVFVLAAFACVVADRDQVRARLAAAVADGSIATHWAGHRAGRPLVAVRRRRAARSDHGREVVGRVLDRRLRRADRDLGHHRPAGGRHPSAGPGGGPARPGAEPVVARLSCRC